MNARAKERCPWCLKDDIYRHYHDTVWGVPEHDDRRLLAKLILDGAQAGLSWHTVLVRTERYEKAFDGWDAQRIAGYGPKDVERLMNDPGIIRNRQKILSAIGNSRAWIRIMEQGPGAFDRFVWKHVDHRTVVNHWTTMAEVPTRSPVSDALSRDLRGAGFSFVDTTIVYAYMQAIGMVDDHLVGCWRRAGS